MQTAIDQDPLECGSDEIDIGVGDQDPLECGSDEIDVGIGVFVQLEHIYVSVLIVDYFHG